MASLTDVPVVVKQIGAWTLAKRVWQQVGEDAVFTWGAALAYSWMFAIFPFLVFLLSLVPLIPDRFKPDVEQDVSALVDRTLTGDAAAVVKTQVHGVLNRESAGGFLSFGLILTIWAASGGMAMTMTALDIAYDIDAEKGRPFIKKRLIAIAMTLVVASLVILVMVLLPVGTGVLKWLIKQGAIFGWLVIVTNIARYLVALLLLFTVLAIIYHFGPSFKHRFQAITPGAIFSVAVWVVLGFAFKLYLTKFGGAASYNKTYGAVAGAVILLLFFYIDALVLLIGAELNSEIDFAVLGIPSKGGQPTEPAAPTANSPEQQALAEELQARRSEPPEPVSCTPAPDKAHSSFMNRALMAVTGVWAVAIIVSKITRAKSRHAVDPRPTPQRLRETYPVTYQLVRGTDQSNGKSG